MGTPLLLPIAQYAFKRKIPLYSSSKDKVPADGFCFTELIVLSSFLFTASDLTLTELYSTWLLS